MDMKKSLSTLEVAEVLDISKNTVYELIKRGELPSYRVGRKVRVDMEDVEYYKNKSRTANVPASFNGSQKKIDVSVPLKGEYIYYDNQPSYNNNFIICGQDILLDILTRHLENYQRGVQALRYYTGSYNGLVDLYKGKVTVASCHLWDGDEDIYNIPYVRRLLPGVPCVIINLACRMQGFYVAKGNPKNITSWNDLARPDVVMVNRERGCGVRVLIDEHLRKLKISPQSINGYENEELSHLSVASNIARGEADVAVGNEKTAQQVQNIQFVPIQKEKYDLVIKKEDINKPAFQSVLEIIKSKEFHYELIGIGGYDISETGKIIAET
ncbi:MAG: helix-turn-helix transcriptional regulator [Bacillota bacterium]|nr:helix-turn-helix transcriptional regulator [Bacillota bacterium]